MTILLVEDNEAIILGLEYLLKEEGFGCLFARTGGEAREQLRRGAFDLVLLDIALPDGDGWSLCRQLRRSDPDIPVIFLTAREEELDVVQGLELGADDYIIKPFRNRELISRIKAVLRRRGKGSPVICCGDIRMDTGTGRVYRDGQEIGLTKLEYRILHTMMSAPGKLFTREEILAGIWDISGNFVEDNTLSVTVKRIREKLGDRDGQIIRTVRGIGYRLER